MQVHEGQRRYQYSMCERGFFSSSSLKEHELAHRGEKPHKCPHCEYASNIRGNVRKHINNIHTKEAKYMCKDCGKSFTNSCSRLLCERSHEKKSDQDSLETVLENSQSNLTSGVELAHRQMWAASIISSSSTNQ